MARATASEQAFLRALVLGRPPPGRAGAVVGDAVAKAAGVPRQGRAPGADAARRPRRGRRGRAGRRATSAQFRLRGRPADPPDARLDRAGRRRPRWRRPGRRPSSGSSTARASRSTATAATSAIFTRTLDDVTARMPEVVAAALALPADAFVLDGEAIALREDGRPEPFQVTGSRFASKSGAVGSRRCSSTSCTSTARTCSTRRLGARAGARGASCPSRVARPARAAPTSSCRDPRAGARPRGRGRQGAGRALRRRAPRRRVAEGQAGAHARPRGAGRRVGLTGGAAGGSRTCGSARATTGRVRDARQDVQGADRRDARVADRGAARRWRPGATGTSCTCGRSSSWRSPSTACRRARATRAASRCGSRACCATGRTSRRRRRTRSSGPRGAWK